MRPSSIIGSKIYRVDSIDKVCGRITYMEDTRLPNMLYGKFLRSKYAHAKILKISTDKAKKLAGVKAIITGQDVPFTHGLYIKDRPFLAIDKVRYVGEPIVAVAAVSEEIAEKALELIQVEYDELPAALDPLKSMKSNSPIIHENLSDYYHSPLLYSSATPKQQFKNTNICYHFKLNHGDIEKGFEEADFIFEDTYKIPMKQHGCLETHNTIAKFVASTGDYVLWANCQSPNVLREILANSLQIPLQRIRVICPLNGGGFGGKAYPCIEVIAIALAMHTDGYPVKISLNREEEFTSTNVGHPAIIDIKTGVMKNGKIKARQVKIVWDAGAYADCSPFVCQQGSYVSAGPYEIPNVHIDTYTVYTNKPIGSAFRGYGLPQVGFACESQMDDIATRLGINPSELRLKNCFRNGSITPTGEKLSNNTVGLKKCIDKVVETIGAERGKTKNRGTGIACMWKSSKAGFSIAIIKLDRDGKVKLQTNSTEMGQGWFTIASQIISEELGVPLENIRISTPDTAVAPYDASTTSSRTTFNMGNAVKMAAKNVKLQLLSLASNILNVEPENLVFKENSINYTEIPERKIQIKEIIDRFYGGRSIIGTGVFCLNNVVPPLKIDSGKSIRPTPFWMYGCHAAEVEVDTETGKFKILKVIAAHDVGKVMNILTCEGQIEGGVIQGIGHTCYEEMLIGEKGEILNPNFLDYKMPTALDIPEIVPIIVETPHKDGPYGAIGIGEMTLVPTAPAIANAIYDAIGVRIKDLPITPEKILRALKEKKI